MSWLWAFRIDVVGTAERSKNERKECEIHFLFCSWNLFLSYTFISVEHPFIRIGWSRGRYLCGAAREFSGVQQDAATSTA